MNIVRNIVANSGDSLVMTNLYGIPVEFVFFKKDPFHLSYEFLTPSKSTELKIRSGMYGPEAVRALRLLWDGGRAKGERLDIGVVSAVVSFNDDLPRAGVGLLRFPRCEKEAFREFIVGMCLRFPDKVALQSRLDALDDGSEKLPHSRLLSAQDRKASFLYCDDVRPMSDNPHLSFGKCALWRNAENLGLSKMTGAQAEYFKRVVRP